ncbi:MAG: FAD-binding protein [Blautia sp.]|nr:FAD-binding protein [Blautia sp.]
MKTMTRASFLKSALAGAASVAATGILGQVSAFAEEKGTYTPGTYSATAKGMESDVTVTMTFSADAITDVQIDVSGETPERVEGLAEKMGADILAAQNAEVDAFSAATVSSNAVKEAAAQCIADAKGVELVKVTAQSETGDGAEPYTSWMKAPEEVTEFEAEYEAEVCVCGHGYAGITSCRELAEQGHSVILLEKVPEDRYQAIGNEFAALNPDILKQRGVPEVDPLEFYQNFMLNTGNYANQDLIMKFALNSGETTNWYLSELTEEDFATMTTAYFPEAEGQLRQVGALKFWPSVCSFYGECNQTRIQGYNRKVAQEHGAKILFGTSAYYVIMKDGVVEGVVGQTETGYIKVNCKAVILATGGFGSNEEMMNYFFKDIKGCFIEKNGDALSAMMDHDGAGIRMGYWAGGHLETWGIPGMNMKHYSPSASVQATMPQALWLDHKGRRFCNEFYGTIEHRGRASLFMNRDAFYVVFDKNFPEYRCHLVPQHGAWSPLNGNLESFQKELDTAYQKYLGTYVEPEEEEEPVQAGPFRMAPPDYAVGETIEELADNLGLEGEVRENFIASVARYNEMCDAGKDMDYGRDSAVLFPVKEAPFYAVKTTPTIGSTMVTMGGLLTDGEQNVLDQNMDPIPGLYASGNTCGRRFGNEYFTPIPGISLAMAIVLGRECGRSVAKFLEK